MRTLFAISRVSLLLIMTWSLGCTCPTSSTKTEMPASDQGATTNQPTPPNANQLPPAPADSNSSALETGDPTPPEAAESLPAQGMPCPEGQCAEGLACMTYYGIAGPRGPAFTSCEISCAQGGDGACPDGQACITIADGPGRVCRPRP